MRLASALLHFMVAVSCAPLFAQNPSQGTPPAWVQPLDDLRVRYLQMSQDLQEIADPPSAPDAEVAIELSNMASAASMYVSAVGDLLYLNDKVTDPGNRGFARGMVRLRLQDYGRQLDASIKSVNRYLPLIKTPGVAQTALRFRDELREGRDLLKATVVK